MKDWDDYRFILALARQKSLRGAAKALGVNHSTVSRKLSWLNQSAGNDLFEKTPLGYQVTSLGQQWLKTAEEMEVLTLSAERKQRALTDTELSGKVSLSLSNPIAEYILPEAFNTFNQEFPNIELCIDATEAVVNLDRSEADVVVRSAQNPPDHLVGRRLFPYSVCYYANRDYFHGTSEDNFTWIGSESDPKHPQWIEQSPFPNKPVKTRTTGYHSRYLALCAGMGLARAACFMADQNPALMRLPGASPFPTMDFWVLTHPDLRDSPRIRAVMNYLTEAMRKKQSLIQGELPI